MTTPPFTPPPGTGVVAGPQIFTNPPQLPGVITNPPAVATPAVTASPMTVTNTTGVDVNAYLAATTSIGPVVVNGVSLPGTTGASQPTDVYLPAGQSMTITYSGTLTMKWQAV